MNGLYFLVVSARLKRRRSLLVPLLCAALFSGPIAAFAADQTVTNTNDSGPGSLRQAVADVGTGEDVSFQTAVVGQTINLSSDLDVTKSMNFLNDSGGSVTTDFGTNRMSVTSGSTIGLASGLTFQAQRSDTTYTIRTDGGMAIDGGIAGTIRATSTGYGASAIHLDWIGAGTLTINGGIPENARLEATGAGGSSYGIESYGDTAINGGIAGTISVQAPTSGNVCGVYMGNGTSTLTIEGIADTASIETQADDYATGIQSGNNFTVTDGLAGTITATSSGGGAVAVYVSGTTRITGGVSGTIAGSGTGYEGGGIWSWNELHIADGISGSVSGTDPGGYVWTMWGGYALDGGDADTPLLITGDVTANGGASAWAVEGGTVNLKVSETGTLSAVSSGGDAHAVRSHGSGNDKVELVAGSTVVGDIDLGTGTGDTLILSGTTGTTTYAGDVKGVENLNATGGNWTLSGCVSGTAAVNVSGGTLTLTGNNTCTGGTSVSGGMLVVNGQIVGDTEILAGGTLCGTGQTANLTNSGTVAPGNSIGTLTVAGNYTQNAGTTLEIEINNAGASDVVAASGTAQINGGTVEVKPESGAYSTTTYTFLTATGGVTGEFDGVTGDLPNIQFSLIYNTDNVQLLLRRIDFITSARTFNERALASYLDAHSLGASGDFDTVIQELSSLSPAEARAAFNAMDGELYGSLLTVGIENTDRFLRTVATRLRSQSMTQGRATATDYYRSSLVRGQCGGGCGGRGNGWESWADGYGTGAQIASDGNASGLNYSVGGIAFGLERWLDYATRFGAVGGYSQTFVALDDRADRGTIDSAQAGVYLHRDTDWGYATGIAAYGYGGYDMRRQVTMGSLNRTARSDYSGNDFSFYYELGKNYRIRQALLQPYVALQYIQLHQNGFWESGANSVDLSVGGVHADSFRGLLGTRLVRTFLTRRRRLVLLEGRALWRHEFLDEERILDAGFVGQPGGPFAIRGVNVDRDAAILGTGVTFALAEGVKLFTNYDVLTSANYTAHAGSGGLEMVW